MFSLTREDPATAATTWVGSDRRERPGWCATMTTSVRSTRRTSWSCPAGGTGTLPTSSSTVPGNFPNLEARRLQRTKPQRRLLRTWRRIEINFMLQPTSNQHYGIIFNINYTSNDLLDLSWKWLQISNCMKWRCGVGEWAPISFVL